MLQVSYVLLGFFILMLLWGTDAFNIESKFRVIVLFVVIMYLNVFFFFWEAEWKTIRSKRESSHTPIHCWKQSRASGLQPMTPSVDSRSASWLSARARLAAVWNQMEALAVDPKHSAVRHMRPNHQAQHGPLLLITYVDCIWASLFQLFRKYAIVFCELSSPRCVVEY